ncbi:bifunctional glycoside hydrolase 114/ polysaccharide deacetylase family protein [soil metagenome]
MEVNPFRHGCYCFIMIVITLVWSLLCYSEVKALYPSVAFYYDANPPPSQLNTFNIAVVHPGSHFEPKQFNSSTRSAFAYVSVGEVSALQVQQWKLPMHWLIAHNEIWHNHVLDQSQPQWQNFFIEKIITPLWQQGYRGFFLDTLDSYQLANLKPSDRQKQIAGLATLIQSINSKYPQAKIILNRGFELLPLVHTFVYAVAAESLFNGWNQKQQKYYAIAKPEQEALLKELKVAQQYNLPVIVIDYVDPKQPAKALEIIKKIQALNMIAWIADNNLTKIDVNVVPGADDNLAATPLARKILIVYRPQEKGAYYPTEFNLTDMPFDYYGYIAEHVSVDDNPPTAIDPKHYAGIIVWAKATSGHKWQDWLLKHKQMGIPIVFMDGFPFLYTQQNFNAWGLQYQPYATPAFTVYISQLDKNMVGLEAKPIANGYFFIPVHGGHSKVALQIKDQSGQIEDAIAITPWGGYALPPYVHFDFANTEATRWILNPMMWLPKALRLPPMPVPDVTTENGRRIMIVHIDGDGFANLTEWYPPIFSGIKFKQEILMRYQIPTSVSVITGEIAANGLYPKLTSQLIPIAQDIFRVPWVEIANHTFSHPFDWSKMLSYPRNGTYNLAIANYKYNLKAEITDSTAYIDQALAPANKRCKMLFWSGEGDVNSQALKLAYASHLDNLNGGGTKINYVENSLANISPMGIMQEKYLQIFAPITNEMPYTNEWHGPYYGFERVVETFKLTDAPHRFKPIDIYYHFYSVTKIAALTALKKVYDYALAQPVINFYASEYTAKVHDFYATTVAKMADGGWKIHTTGALHELRLPHSMGYPNLTKSHNIIGFNSYNDSYYIHLGTELTSLLYLTKQAPTEIYLHDANARVTQFQRTSRGIKLHLVGYMPLNFRIANMQNCNLYQGHNLLAVTTKDSSQSLYTYQLKTVDSDELEIKC